MSPPRSSDVSLRTAGLEQLVRSDSATAGDWSLVRDLVPAAWATLDGPILAQLRTARRRPGSNRDGGAHLFVYYVYESEPETDVDPFVVGVTIGPAAGRSDDEFTVHGDIAGETRGDVLFEVPSRDIAGWDSMTRGAAHDAGEILACQADLILAALRDPSRRA